MSRPTLDEIFMRQAHDWARMSTCEHLNVGAVLTIDGRAIASGYNGSPPGLPHCHHDDSHLPWQERERCTNTNHAEGNVLAFAARRGQSTEGATLYCTHSPCRACAGLLIAAGITRVFWGVQYATHGLGSAGLQWMQDAGVIVNLEPWTWHTDDEDLVPLAEPVQPSRKSRITRIEGP